MKALVNGEPEHKRIPRNEAGFHLRQRPPNPAVHNRGMLARFYVTVSARLLPKFSLPVRPYAFVANPVARHRLDAVSDLRPAVGADRALNCPFIVVNEKTRRPECFRMRLLELIELDRGGDGVRRAAVYSALLINRRAIGSQIDACRQ